MAAFKEMEAGDEVDYIVATQEAYDRLKAEFGSERNIPRVGDPYGVVNRLYGIPVEKVDTEAAAMFRAAELSHEGLKVCVLTTKTADEVEPV